MLPLALHANSLEVSIEENAEERNPSLSFPWNVTQYWRECLLIAGVIVAIIGIAIAITSGAIPCAICFGVALAVSLIGLYLVCQDRSLEQLQQTCRELEAQTTELNRLLGELQQTNAALVATQQGLQAEVERLAGEIGQLHERIQQLTLIATQLAASAQAIEVEVRQFQEGNQQFSGSIRSLQELSGQIHRANALREEVLAGYQEAWQVSVGQLTERMEALQDTLRDDAAWKTRLDMLDVATEALSRTQQEHAAATASLTSTTRRLEALYEQLQRFEEQLEGLASERQGFAELRQQFQALFQQAVPKNE